MSIVAPPATRLAPSPTGAFHLGNARTFIVNWALARRYGWRIVLRIEDLDGPRVKKGADRSAMEDLRWLGLDWDGDPVYQSHRSAYYKTAIDQLLAARHAYPCICSRKDVDSVASAPHAEDGAAVYPGVCRNRFATLQEARSTANREPNIRFRVPEADTSIVSWNDGFRGPQTVDARTLGDFVIAKGDGTAAYQLAVVVDDSAAGITHVIRGDDLVDSTSRQIILYRALQLGDDIPQYTHLPLIIGPDGRRLAKRHGDTRLNTYRSQGVAAGRIRALVAKWCGIDAEGEISCTELINHISLDRIPRQPIVFGPAEDAWLRLKL